MMSATLQAKETSDFLVSSMFAHRFLDNSLVTHTYVKSHGIFSFSVYTLKSFPPPFVPNYIMFQFTTESGYNVKY